MQSETPERIAEDAAASAASTARSSPRKLLLGTRVVMVHGLPMHNLLDLYHTALKVSWPTFFGGLATMFLLLNSIFACLYQLGDAPIANQFPHGIWGAFFFSVETLATVGYGDMHPRTFYGHVVATFEIFIGMSGVALATGLIFARFSRPRAKIMFARDVVIHPLEGRMTLMARAANARQNVIAEAYARLRLVRVETSPEGYIARRIYDLKLVRDQHPIFLLGWNLMHVIDEQSPLFGETAESLAAKHATLMVVIEGSDESTTQTMQARYTWNADDIRWQHRYVDIMRDEDGVTHVDYARFHETEPFDAAHPGAGPRGTPW